MSQPKIRGGLGLRKSRDYNIVMLAKVGWKLHNRTEALWREVFRGKYLYDMEFVGFVKKNGSSSTWQGLLKTQSCIENGIKWQIRDG